MYPTVYNFTSQDYAITTWSTKTEIYDDISSPTDLDVTEVSVNCLCISCTSNNSTSILTDMSYSIATFIPMVDLCFGL